MSNKMIITTFSASLAIATFTVNAGETSTVQEGKRLTLEFCQACHQYAGTEQAGTVAPPLLGMKARFPDRKKLYNIIYDPQVAIKKDTMMPPFGRNELLAKDEIEKVIDFLYTL
ncbi:MAG: sulfur oxidation c-type cytochrome SoxX [Gammaproteobacteria bacterium]|jgi:sulfur-oxidizing protein SoxX